MPLSRIDLKIIAKQESVLTMEQLVRKVDAEHNDYLVMLNARIHKGQRLFDGYCHYDVWIRGLPLGHKFG